jgi:hypothetical protein
LWNLSYGEDYEWFRELFESGEFVSQLETKPETTTVIDYLLLLWNKVAASRPPGFCVTSAVPLSEFEAAYRIYSVAEFCDLEYFVDWMNFLDGAARQFFDDTAKRDQERKNPKIVKAHR